MRRYAKEGEARLEPSNVRLTWGRPEWFGNVAREHAACRDAAALIDMSFMSKFRVQVLLARSRRMQPRCPLLLWKPTLFHRRG